MPSDSYGTKSETVNQRLQEHVDEKIGDVQKCCDGTKFLGGLACF